MTKENNVALHTIMESLKSGYRYGRDCYNVRFPYFSASLYRTSQGNIGWTHYGSSANKMTLSDLNWIITVIFKTTPSEFLREYIRNDQSKISA